MLECVDAFHRITNHIPLSTSSHQVLTKCVIYKSVQANLLTFVTVPSSESRRTSAFSRAKTVPPILTFGITIGCIHTRTHMILTLLLILVINMFRVIWQRIKLIPHSVWKISTSCLTIKMRSSCQIISAINLYVTLKLL